MVVIDEVVANGSSPRRGAADLLAYAAGFVLFRISDIVKPWPVSWVDRAVHGGLGMMLDDSWRRSMPERAARW